MLGKGETILNTKKTLSSFGKGVASSVVERNAKAKANMEAAAKKKTNVVPSSVATASVKKAVIPTQKKSTPQPLNGGMSMAPAPLTKKPVNKYGPTGPEMVKKTYKALLKGKSYGSTGPQVVKKVASKVGNAAARLWMGKGL